MQRDQITGAAARKDFPLRGIQIIEGFRGGSGAGGAAGAARKIRGARTDRGSAAVVARDCAVQDAWARGARWSGGASTPRFRWTICRWPGAARIRSTRPRGASAWSAGSRDARLGERCRELFRLKLEGYTFPEIQKRLEVAALNTLYTWDFRCRKQTHRTAWADWEKRRVTRGRNPKLIGGYATGSLTDAERQTAVRGRARRSGDLFDELAREQAVEGNAG